MATIELLDKQGNIPQLFLDWTTLRRMQLLAKASKNNEVSWFCYLDQREGDWYICGDLVVPHQRVHGTTTEVSTEEMSKMIEAEIDAGKDHTKLRVWGHSHVNMAVSPSGQDRTQAKEYIQDYGGTFICLIINLRHELRVDIWDSDRGIIMNDVKPILYFEGEQELYSAYDELYKERVKGFGYRGNNQKKIPQGQQTIQGTGIPQGRLGYQTWGDHFGIDNDLDTLMTMLIDIMAPVIKEFPYWFIDTHGQLCVIDNNKNIVRKIDLVSRGIGPHEMDLFEEAFAENLSSTDTGERVQNTVIPIWKNPDPTDMKDTKVFKEKKVELA